MRFIKFNTVGVGGVVVQLTALWAFEHFTPLSYVAAIILAVETAILHNFVWHEAWTWREKPVCDRWRRLLKFHLANGFVSIFSNVVLTYLYQEIAGLPLLAANLAAIVTASLLNFWVARAWVFRGLLICALLAPCPSEAAVITTTLQQQTVVAWDKYIANFEKSPAHPPLDVKDDKIKLVDLHASGDVPDGFIHHWVGATIIPNSTVNAVESILRDYDHYTRIYPDLKLAEAKQTGPNRYDVRLITERVEPIGLHFAFDMHSHVEYKRVGGESLVESRSYSIRESDSGHAPYTDLMPEGSDHGILWRLNIYWRFRQIGTSVYAECQAISLSRKPLFGTIGQVNVRARDQLGSTLRHTKARALENVRAQSGKP